MARAFAKGALAIMMKKAAARSAAAKILVLMEGLEPPTSTM